MCLQRWARKDGGVGVGQSYTGFVAGLRARKAILKKYKWKQYEKKENSTPFVRGPFRVIRPPVNRVTAQDDVTPVPISTFFPRNVSLDKTVGKPVETTHGSSRYPWPIRACIHGVSNIDFVHAERTRRNNYIRVLYVKNKIKKWSQTPLRGVASYERYSKRFIFLPCLFLRICILRELGGVSDGNAPCSQCTNACAVICRSERVWEEGGDASTFQSSRRWPTDGRRAAETHTLCREGTRATRYYRLINTCLLDFRFVIHNINCAQYSMVLRIGVRSCIIAVFNTCCAYTQSRRNDIIGQNADCRLFHTTTHCTRKKI